MSVGCVSLADIDLARLAPVYAKAVWRDGVDHSRWIFAAPRREGPRRLVKLWNPSYLRAETMPPAVAAGFYGGDLVPGLLALVLHKGVCRGYVMMEGTRPRTPDADFVRRLWTATARSGWLACQYRPSHLRVVGGRTTLIDLENVWRLGETPFASLEFDDPDYAALARARASGPLDDATAAAMAEAHIRSVSERAARRARAPLDWARRKGVAAARRLVMRARMAALDPRRLIMQ